MKVYRSRKAMEAIMETYDQLLARWGVPVEERDVRTTYGETHVIACGDKAAPPLVLFHGVGDDSALMWLYNAQELSRHFRLYAVDTLGGPGKSRPNERYGKGFSDQQWLDEVFDGLGLDKAYVAGVSNGGYMAQYYGVHRPERVIRLVCMASSVPTGTGKGGAMKTMMKVFMPEALFPTRANVVKLLKKLSGKNSEVFTDDPLILKHYTALLKGYNNMAMGYHAVEPFTEEQIDLLRDKAIYLVGEADPFAQMGGREALQEHRMNTKLFADVGHGINHEIAQEIDREIVGYLAK